MNYIFEKEEDIFVFLGPKKNSGFLIFTPPNKKNYLYDIRITKPNEKNGGVFLRGWINLPRCPTTHSKFKNCLIPEDPWNHSILTIT